VWRFSGLQAERSELERFLARGRRGRWGDWEGPLSSSTQTAELAGLRRFYRWARSEGLRPDDPTEGIRPPRREPYARARGLSAEEVARLLAAIPVESAAGLRLRALVLTRPPSQSWRTFLTYYNHDRPHRTLGLEQRDDSDTQRRPSMGMGNVADQETRQPLGISRQALALRKPHAQPVINPLMVWLLQSPLHRLVSGSHLLVVYRGRRTGIERRFPVGYATAGDEVVILVGRAEAKMWWRNFLTPWPITLVLRGRTVHGTGLVVRGDSDEVVRMARHYFSRYPRNERALGLRFGGGELPDSEAIRSAVTGLTFILVSRSEGVAR
jgi:hypothetical protein